MLMLRKSKVLSTRRGAVWWEKSVVREAVVDGGRLEGCGRIGEEGIVMRRCTARVRGARSKSIGLRRCILVVGV